MTAKFDAFAAALEELCREHEIGLWAIVGKDSLCIEVRNWPTNYGDQGLMFELYDQTE